LRATDRELIEALDSISAEFPDIPYFVQRKPDFTVPAKFKSFDAMLADAKDDEPAPASLRQGIKPLDPCVYIFTSGTTGEFYNL